MSPLKPYQSKIIVLLTQQELLVAELYRFFASLYPDLREFWNDLAKEQMEHATWVEYLYKKTNDGAVYFNEEKIKTYTVESFVKYLEENLAKVKEKAPTPSAAFSLALNIENSLLIKRSYERFQSADRELSNLLLSLREKKADHRKRLEARSAPYSPSRPAP
jgi:rubrerythrin